jgi:hypothetical protein
VPLVLLAVLIGVPLVGAAVTTNYLVIRNVIFAVPLAFMLVAAGCAYTERRAVGTAVIAALCAIGLAIAVAVPLTVRLHNADWRSAIRMLSSPPVARVWVFLDRFQSTPISEVYLPRALAFDTGAATVSEVDVIGTPKFPGTTAAAIVPGFSLVEHRSYRGLSLSVFRAARPLAVSAATFRVFDARVVRTGP